MSRRFRETPKSEMDAQREMLDELMGVNRNMDRAEDEINDYQVSSFSHIIRNDQYFVSFSVLLSRRFFVTLVTLPFIATSIFRMIEYVNSTLPVSAHTVSSHLRSS